MGKMNREQIDKFYAATPKPIKDLLNIDLVVHKLYHIAIQNNSTMEVMLTNMVVFFQGENKRLNEESFQRELRKPLSIIVKKGDEPV